MKNTGGCDRRVGAQKDNDIFMASVIFYDNGEL
jgi:hypothetical protein